MFEFIKKITPKSDKLGHFFWGAVLTYMIGIPLYLLLDSTLMILAPSLIVSIYKEIVYDVDNGGNKEFLDIIYNNIVAVATIIAMLI